MYQGGMVKLMANKRRKHTERNFCYISETVGSSKKSRTEDKMEVRKIEISNSSFFDNFKKYPS